MESLLPDPLLNAVTENKVGQLATLLQLIARDYAPATLSSSLGVEDMLLMDMIQKHAPTIEIFTLDTGRLPEQTYQLMQKIRGHYGIELRTYYPDTQSIEQFVLKNGPNSIYESVELRKTCCYIRKVQPLQRALKGKRAWIAGLRHQQSDARRDVPLSVWDDQYQLQKFNPLIDWKSREVWDYVRANNVPYNALHDQGYPSIGCAPCSRAVSAGEDFRAGRWWWEHEDTQGKECGLHLKNLGEA